jgi:hypothetical protein
MRAPIKMQNAMFRDLFPYKNRQFGMSNYTTPENADIYEELSKIAIANLKEGDRIQATKGLIEIGAICDNSISYTFRPIDGEAIYQYVEGKQIFNGAISRGFLAMFMQPIPTDAHGLGYIVERDPAVFRLATNNGWVINDKLCLYSGNVQYQ